MECDQLDHRRFDGGHWLRIADLHRASGEKGCRETFGEIAMPEWVPLNWGLMKNPFNWIIILLMVLIAAFAFGLGADYLKGQKEQIT